VELLCADDGLIFSPVSYAEKLRDPRWQKKRLRIFERDEFRCRDCKADNRPLHVHHCFYAAGDPWDTDDEFLITVCEDCHADRQVSESRARLALARLFACTSFAANAVAEALETARALRDDGRRKVFIEVQRVEP